MNKYYITLLTSTILLFSACKEENKKIENLQTKQVENKTIDNQEIKKDSVVKIDTIRQNLEKKETEIVDNKTLEKNNRKDKLLKSDQNNKSPKKVVIKKSKPLSNDNVDLKKDDSENINNTVTKVAIYPGCDNEALKGQQFASDCFSTKIRRDLADELQDYASDRAGEGYTGIISTKLDFVINADGNVVNITSIGDELFGNAAILALKRISARHSRRNIVIKPAIDIDGKPISSKFVIPLKINIE